MSYAEYKKSFIRKHGKGDWRVETSPMREDDSYVKTYMFSDGAVMTEVNRPVYVECLDLYAMIDGKYVKVKEKTTVKMFETECWNTDDARSVKWREVW